MQSFWYASAASPSPGKALPYEVHSCNTESGILQHFLRCGDGEMILMNDALKLTCQLWSAEYGGEYYPGCGERGENAEFVRNGFVPPYFVGNALRSRVEKEGDRRCYQVVAQQVQSPFDERWKNPLSYVRAVAGRRSGADAPQHLRGGPHQGCQLVSDVLEVC